MTEFLKQLSMKVWNGETLIFDAKADELGGLQENTPLGTFRTGETAKLKVELSVPIELDNKFANRVGEVDWVFHVEAFNESQLTVRKVWADGNWLHAGDEITVNLLKDGKVERTQELNAENGWTYTFDRLVEGHVWTVEEAQVPAGYRVSYQTEGNTTTIINSRIYVPTPPNPPVKPTPPEEITVVKQWSGDNAKIAPIPSRSRSMTAKRSTTRCASVIGTTGRTPGRSSTAAATGRSLRPTFPRATHRPTACAVML